NIMNQLHDEHCLAYTGTTDDTGFTSFDERSQKINHLDASFENFVLGSRRVDWRNGWRHNIAEFFAFDRCPTIERTTESVKNSPNHLIANWNLQTCTTGGYCHTLLNRIISL